MKTITHKKSDAFYQEAEDMSEGWGEYLKQIDKLKDKKWNNQSFTRSEFCWTLYGAGYCSTTWRAFEKYAKANVRFKLKYTSWWRIFEEWITGKL